MAPGDPRAADAHGPNAARLMAVKAQYDPDGVLTAIPLPGPGSGMNGELA